MNFESSVFLVLSPEFVDDKSKIIFMCLGDHMDILYTADLWKEANHKLYIYYMHLYMIHKYIFKYNMLV